MFNETVWRYGAKFLYENKSEWPSLEFIISKVNEMEKKSNGECILMPKAETSELGLGNIIEANRCSSFQKLLRSKKIGGEVE